MVGNQRRNEPKLAANNNESIESIEEDLSCDLHRLLTVESARNPELNNIQACTNEGSILAEALTNACETTLESNTAVAIGSKWRSNYQH